VTTDVRTAGESGPTDSAGLGDYEAPVDDVLLALEVAGLDEVLALPTYADVDRESVELALTEFGRFASDVVAPTDRVGDVQGSTLNAATGRVTTPNGFKEVYAQYVTSGWGAAQFPSAHGGGGLPSLVGIALQEMLASANLALSLNPVLTHSGIELLLAWGTEEQRSRYLPRLLTGEWSGTMNLTEPEAGSDLGEIRTHAVPDGQGNWQISGTKIFITWGEHDMAENIVHLVLARTPGAPAGTRGLSLFLVPKVTVTPDGALGEPNALRCLRVEEKLGIHASPTCVMEFDGAVGELVGAEHGGIRAMFTMMNAARLAIGVQGPGVAERAFQHAYRYARDRQQGRAAGTLPPQRSAILEHPDVRRMLLSMRTSVLAGRLLVYTATYHRDMVRGAEDPEKREAAQAYLDLLTPVAKAWSSDLGFAAASTGVQVLGGAGFIEESGMAQRLRDIRIAPIYEGTNGIQAIDLVTRKIPREGGRWVRALLDQIAATANGGTEASPDLRESYAIVADAAAVLRTVTEQLLLRIDNAPEDALAGATTYLELMGLTVGGWLMLRRAEHAAESQLRAAAQIAAESEFFATEFVARTAGLSRPILAGAGRLSGLPSSGRA
jgi:alkylation response protein AidB-like acyl-CoA dehydrogenase